MIVSFIDPGAMPLGYFIVHLQCIELTRCALRLLIARNRDLRLEFCVYVVHPLPFGKGKEGKGLRRT